MLHFAIHSSVDGHFSCFYLLAVMNNSAMIQFFCGQIFTFMFLFKILKNFVLLFWPCLTTSGILVPHTGIEVRPWQWKHIVLMTGLAGHSQWTDVFISLECILKSGIAGSRSYSNSMFTLWGIARLFPKCHWMLLHSCQQCMRVLISPYPH